MHKAAQGWFTGGPSNDLGKTSSSSLLDDWNAYAAASKSDTDADGDSSFDLEAAVRTANDKVTSTFNVVSKGVRGLPGNFNSATSNVPSGKSLMYFGLFLSTGVFFIFVAFTIFLPVMVLKPQKFAICFTIGCAFIVGSFFALKGPKNQLDHMFSKERLPFTLGFVGSMVGTVYVSMVVHSYFLSVFFSVLQNPKMQRAVENLMKKLNEESMMRIGREKDKKMERVEAGLVKARALIREAILESRNSPPLFEDEDSVPQLEIYRNPYVFQRSYLLMEKLLKIFVYEEGEPPLFHYGPSKNIYSTEGIFLGLIESNKNFRTYDPNQAHLYFLPFSVVMILQHLFDPIQRDKAVLERVVGDYVRVISSKYSYWNKSFGADHFMLSCHDWGPRATWYVHQLYFTSIRVLCNANTSEFFNPRKDVSFPEINLPTGDLTALVTSPISNSNNRSILAFFAGKLHGPIRPLLFRHWNNSNSIRVFEKIPENSSLSYKQMMESSKYCLCPSGYEVASPRIVEAIYAECVPVLISQDYVLPFNDVLDWDKFSVTVKVNDLWDLKKILMGIGEDKYKLLKEGVRNVQRHFVVNDPPKRYDVFNMMIHSLWLRRLNLRINI